MASVKGREFMLDKLVNCFGRVSSSSNVQSIGGLQNRIEVHGPQIPKLKSVVFCSSFLMHDWEGWGRILLMHNSSSAHNVL